MVEKNDMRTIENAVVQMSDEEYIKLSTFVVRLPSERHLRLSEFYIPSLTDDRVDSYVRVIDVLVQMGDEEYANVMDEVLQESDEKYTKVGTTLPPMPKEKRAKVVRKIYDSVASERKTLTVISDRQYVVISGEMKHSALKATNNVVSSMVFAKSNHCSDEEVSLLIVEHEQDLKNLGAVNLFNFNSFDGESENKLYFMNLNNAQVFFLTMLLPNTEIVKISKRCFAQMLAR